MHWLNLRDHNTSFFHMTIKNKQGHNRIDMLKSSNREVLNTLDQIKGEVHRFYKELLGTRAYYLKGIEIPVFRNGRQLSSIKAESLILPISEPEIVGALSGIGDHKVPSCDGFNAKFYMVT